MIRKKNSEKRVKASTIRIDPDLHVDENCPVVLRKKAEAIKSLTETPLPDWVLNRHLRKKSRKSD